MRFSVVGPARFFAVAVFFAAGPIVCAQVETPGPLETRPDNMDRVEWHIVDVEGAIEFIQTQLDHTTREADRTAADRTLARLAELSRPKRVRLTLEDVVHRTMLNSFAARVQSYVPAINMAAVVEAEAAFDVIYFTDVTKNLQNRPVASDLIGSNNNTFDVRGGFRKLLPTGASLSTTLNLSRTATDNAFQTINPVYSSAFVAALSQPLLRNSGVDFNRSMIRIAQNDQRVGENAFKRALRDILFSVEEAYWRLVQARREVVIRARLLAELEKTYDYLVHRSNFDIYHIQLSQTKANVESSRADFIRVLNRARDAEDALLAIMNDPELNLVDDIEVIPVDFPAAAPMALDRVAAAGIAIEERAEIAEARLAVATAALRVGQAKNQALPRLDLGFQYTTSGLGTDADEAFDEMSESDFLEYSMTLNLELPIGNRARNAAFRRARLAHAQAIAQLNHQFEQVVLDVNRAARAIQTALDRIAPSLESADANEQQVASTVARAERKDFSALNQELSARSSLANSRSALLEDLVTYNIAVIALERAKGTLLEYNNIQLADGDD